MSMCVRKINEAKRVCVIPTILPIDAKMSSDDDDNNHHIRRFNVHHRIMISAIFSLLAVMMIIISIHFYIKYLQKRRRESITRLAGIESSTQQNITRADRDDHAAEPPKTGLDQLLIAKVLPQSIHKQADHHGEVIECSICLSNIEDETIVRLLPNCKHIFHVECIDMWLHSNITCPVCRTAAEPIVQTAENDDLRPAVQPTAPPQPSSRLNSFRRVSLGRESSQPVQPTAPPMMDEQPSSRMSSFRRMLSRERSLRVQSCGDGLVGSSDIERH